MTYLFEKFDKIPRLARDVIITEKLDGTNAQIVIIDTGAEDFLGLPDEPPVAQLGHATGSLCMYAGSRKRYIYPGEDNFGFAQWVCHNAEELFTLGRGKHFGEWWGQGIQRKYGMNHKVFSLFNRKRWYTEARGAWVQPEDVTTTQALAPECCDVVPILGWGEFDLEIVDVCLVQLELQGSVAAPGFMEPEGIVIWHRAANQLFKKTIENDGVPKGK